MLAKTHIHLIGIGGTGMSAIARVLLGRGVTVSGSDQNGGPITDGLAAAGARIFIGHTAEQVDGVDLVLRSSAIPDHNPEVAAAHKAGIPVLKRSDFLGDLMADKVGIAVAGTHGKTTTTGMISHLLLETGRDPSFIVGGILPSLGINGRAGSGDHFVIEADEYDHMFLGLKPQIAIITNIEHDHPDIFGSEADYFDAFHRFIDRLPTGGTLIVATEDRGVNRLLKDKNAVWRRKQLRLIGYAVDYKESLKKLDGDSENFVLLSSDPLNPINDLGGVDLTLRLNGEIIGSLKTALPGYHNQANTLAAVATAYTLGIDLADYRHVFETFTGMSRRFEIKGIINDIAIIDDYAHHPTEIETNLSAMKTRFPKGRVWAVWQPHTFSRLKMLYDRFQRAFGEADEVIVLDVYRSRDRDDFGLSAARFVAEMQHPSARHIDSLDRFNNAADYLIERLKPHDSVIIMNAGSATQLSTLLVNNLETMYFHHS